MIVKYNGNEMDYSFNDIVIPVHFTKKQPVYLTQVNGNLSIRVYNGTYLIFSTVTTPFFGELKIDLCVFSAYLNKVSSLSPYSSQKIVMYDNNSEYTVSVINQNADTYDLSSRSYTVKTNRDYNFCILGGERGRTRSVDLYLKGGISSSMTTTNGNADPIHLRNVTKMVIDDTISINYEEVCSGITVKWSDLFGNIMHYTFESFKIQEQLTSTQEGNSMSECLIQVDDIAFGDNVEMLNFICRASEIEVYNSNIYVWRKAECTNKAGAVFNNSDQGTKVSITLSCNIWN